MNPSCGCCAGVPQVVPEDTSNRPGLSSIRYRIGTHSTFLETMKARLANFQLTQEVLDRCQGLSYAFPLADLRTRDGEDPAIALLDAWALIADVLTFYQERIANEGYLRTATESLSINELARLIGYKPRPGVSASVYLAYTLEKDNAVDIAPGSGAQSIPGPGELPQSFETSAVLKAQDIWNNLQPRMTQPQKITPDTDTIYVKGVNTNLKANDRLLFDFFADSAADGADAGRENSKPSRVVNRIISVEPDSTKNWTKIVLEGHKPGNRPNDKARATLQTIVDNLVTPLAKAPAQHPSDRFHLSLDLKTSFSSSSEALPRSVAALRPELGSRLYEALENARVSESQPVNIFAFRVRAAVFGHNAPKHQRYGPNNQIQDPEEWPLFVPPSAQQPVTFQDRVLIGREALTDNTVETEDASRVSLDAVYDKILAGSWIYLERSNPNATELPSLLSKVGNPTERTRADYGITAKVTELVLERDLTAKWIDPSKEDLSAIRNVTVFAQSEKLDLAEEPIQEPISGSRVELGGIYQGLEAGRWLIVSGERNDVPGTSNVKDAELVMLAGADLDTNPDVPGDSLHTYISLASGGIAYSYVRETVRIYGNVVPATHGETRSEVMGSGDASQPLQSFQLRQSPLTYVSAVTPSGVQSTLQVRVNELLWHEADEVAALGPTDRSFLTRTDENSKTTVIFGNGVRGARVPTGIENIKATYRTGIGVSGNVDAGQITLLTSKPLGVKEVLNPLRASGGAQRESLDQARRNAPVAVMAFDRLISAQDYSDFARSFAGIGKSAAVPMGFQGADVVHVTVAGAENARIDTTSDLFRNLMAAFAQFGDPQQPVQLAVADTLLLLVQATVTVLPDYRFESVVPHIRTALLSAFAFDNRSLGQSIAASEITSIMQIVEGVSHVELTALGTSREGDFTVPASTSPPQVIRVEAARPDPQGKTILPAQIAFLSPDIPESLIITEQKNA
jgi:predicted phage baseplate assembly protein